MQSSLKNKYASLDKYILVKTLGTGYNSKVKLAFDTTSTNSYAAVKIIKHSHPALNLASLKKEIEILQALKHPNIVNLIEFQESADYVKKNGKSYKVVAIVMELVPGGELFEYIADSGKFSDEIARTYFRILIETLHYCHKKGITHRDLKPENLLFDGGFNLKIADFGFATLIAGKDGTNQLHTILGTESYMAPEIHARQPYSGEAVDLFACGIILFIMISGTPPFSKADPKVDPHYKLFSNGKQEVFWKAHERNKPKKAGQDSFYSDDFKNLINNMLALNPSDRLTIDQVKSHPWLQGSLADVSKLRAEFLQRKKMVDAELQKQREAKKQQKLVATQAHHAQGAFAGIQPFRSLESNDYHLRNLEEKVGEQIVKEFDKKINFENSREIQDYKSEGGFRAYTEIFTVMSADFAFKLLCSLSQNKLADFTVSDDSYKIKGKGVKDEGSCTLNIVLTKVDDSTTCIEFHKTSGNVMTFYKVLEDIKQGLPSFECENEKTEQNTEAQSE